MAIAAVFMLVACNKSTDIYGKWEIQEAMGVKTASAETKPFINFEKGGSVNGNASVNIFSGSYKLSGNKLTLVNIGITKMMGASMDVEDAVIDAINNVALVKEKDGKVLVLDSKGKTVMILAKMK